MKKKIPGLIVPILLLSVMACNKDQQQPDRSVAQVNGKRTSVEEAFPGQRGKLRHFVVNGNQVSYYEINGVNVFEGDIILTDAQVRGETEKGAGRTSLAAKWPSNTIYYTIDASVPNQSRVTEAIASCMGDTDIKFVPRTSQADYVTFINDPGNSSNVGKAGGQQFIRIQAAAAPGSIVHEIGHAIGLWHEQSRSDRDSYVIINWAFIASGAEDNFKKYSDLGWDGFDFGPFDFNSIMLYPSNAYLDHPGVYSITKLDGSPFTTQLSSFSPGDMGCVYSMYPQPSVPAQELYIIENSKFYAVDNSTGSYDHIGVPTWANTEAMTSLGGQIYAVENSRLYNIDKNYGTFTQLGAAVWTGTDAMTSLNSMLYIVENSRLYSVNPSNGTYTQLGGASWSGTEGLTAYNNMLYLIENSRLYRVDPANGTYTQLGGAVWTGTMGMTTLGSYLYVIENSRLYKVDPSTGSYTQLGGAVWTGSIGGITTYSGMLYVVNNSGLYRVDPTTGTYVLLGTGNWTGTNAITS